MEEESHRTHTGFDQINAGQGLADAHRGSARTHTHRRVFTLCLYAYKLSIVFSHQLVAEQPEGGEAR